MFPLSIEGSIPIDAKIEADVHPLSQRICAEIKSLELEGQVDGPIVSFVNDKYTYWKPFSDRSIAIIDSGEFVIGGERIRYRLSTLYFFVIGSALLSLPLVFCLVIRMFVGVLLVASLGLFSIVFTYLSVTIRVRRALRRAIATPSPSLSP